jgi:hypothetical protein
MVADNIIGIKMAHLVCMHTLPNLADVNQSIMTTVNTYASVKYMLTTLTLLLTNKLPGMGYFQLCHLVVPASITI